MMPNHRDGWLWLVFFLLSILILSGFYAVFQAFGWSPEPDRIFTEILFQGRDAVDLWNPDAFMGLPVYSDTNGIASLSIPDALLYSLLTPLSGFVNIYLLYILLNFLLFAAGIYMLGRRVNLHPLAVLITALLAYNLPGFLLMSGIEYGRHLLAVSLLPLFLVCLYRLFSHLRPWSFAVCTLALAVLLQRGSVPVIIVTLWSALFLTVAMGLFKKLPLVRLLGKLVLVPALFLSALLLSAYTWLPVLEYVGAAVPLHEKLTVLPLQIVSVLLPSLTQSTHPHFSLPLLYTGGLLYFFGLMLPKYKKAGFAVAAGLLLCVGLLFTDHSMIAIVALPLVFLAGSVLGLDAVLAPRDKNQSVFKSYAVIWGMLFVLLFSALLVFRSQLYDAFIQFFGLLQLNQKTVLYYQILEEWALHLFLFAVIAILVSNARRMNLYLWSGLVLFLLVADFTWVNFESLNALHSNQAEPAAVSKREDTNKRVFNSHASAASARLNITGGGGNCLQHYYEILRETGYHLPDRPWIRNPFLAKYYRTVFRQGDVLEQPVPAQQVMPARLVLDYACMDMFNVGTIISALRIQDARYKLLNKKSPFVYRNTTALPFAFFSDTVMVVSDSKAALDSMKSANFNPAVTALLFEPPPLAVHPPDSIHITWHRRDACRYQMDVFVDQPSCLVISENYYPRGWRAFIDGQRVKSYRTNVCLKSVFMQPGEHRIEFLYQPLSFVTGLWISGAALLALLVGAAAPGVSRIRKKLMAEK
ncbi:MAG: YfhO family protein [candidate division KSB1 bacterium]|nr:YfhO family protein [candidate division KSB1 bacterium]